MQNLHWLQLPFRTEKGKPQQAGRKLIIVLGTILLLTLPSCMKQDHGLPVIHRREITDALSGKILYRTSSDQIVLREFHGKSKTVGTSTVSGAKWSPDGTLFSFVEVTDSVPYMNIYDRNGEKLHAWELKDTAPIELKGLAWSPDGQSIALLKSGQQIVYLEVKSGISSICSLKPGHTYSSLAWCPSNHKITLAEGRSIWLAEAFQNDPPATLLLSDQEPDPIESMDWNANGSMLAFSGGLADSKVKVVDVQGDNCRVLNDSEDGETTPIFGAAPCWYPNGDQVMFVRLNHGKVYWNIGLYITDLNKEYEFDLNIPGYDPDCS